MRININVTSLKSELIVILKLATLIIAGELLLKYSFSFFESVTIYLLLGIESRINRKDFYITDIINKDEQDDFL